MRDRVQTERGFRDDAGAAMVRRHMRLRMRLTGLREDENLTGNIYGSKKGSLEEKRGAEAR